MTGDIESATDLSIAGPKRNYRRRHLKFIVKLQVAENLFSATFLVSFERSEAPYRVLEKIYAKTPALRAAPYIGAVGQATSDTP
jgi:hypothetical protein